MDLTNLSYSTKEIVPFGAVGCEGTPRITDIKVTSVNAY